DTAVQAREVRASPCPVASGYEKLEEDVRHHGEVRAKEDARGKTATQRKRAGRTGAAREPVVGRAHRARRARGSKAPPRARRAPPGGGAALRRVRRPPAWPPPGRRGGCRPGRTRRARRSDERRPVAPRRSRPRSAAKPAP